MRPLSMVRGWAVFALMAWLAPAPAGAYTTLTGTDPRWPGAAMTFRVHASSFGALGTAGAEASYKAWESDSLSTIVTTRGADVATPPATDTRNDVYFESAVSIGSGTLAVTSLRFTASEIVEADITVNGFDFTWADPLPGGCSGRFDLRSTITHEAGHALGLGHSSEADATCEPGPAFDAVLCDATMYYSGGPCEASGQSLECDDLAGIRFLYPQGGTPRADWVPSAFVATPSGGSVLPGQLVTITGTARNGGSITTAAGTAGLHRAVSAGSFPGTVDTAALGAVASCRTAAVALDYTFAAGDAGTRFLNVRLDDGATTTEYSESDNVVSFGPYTVTTAGPVLQVAPTSLTFNATSGQSPPTGQVVTVTNTGGGTFTWTASSNQTWLTVAPTSGAPGATFTASVSHAALGVGMHAATITVTAPGAAGSPASIPVQLTVAAGAVLEVAPASLTFAATQGGPAPPTQALQLSNSGTGSISYSATDDATWLTVVPGSGVVPATLTVSATPTGLAPGSYMATITVDGGAASGSPKLVPVTFNVASPGAPVLAVAPAMLVFSGALGGPAPATQAVSVTNTGTGTLSFTVSDDQTWITVAPGSGTAPAMLTVSVNPVGLPAGSHVGTITVTALGASGSPKTIMVTYQVLSSPSLALSPAALSFIAVAGGANPPARSLTVLNDGAGTLSYTVSDDAPWLSVAPAGGALPAAGSTAHAATASPAGLAVGMHSATITVAAPGADDAPQVVPVTFEVTAQPVLQVTPQQLTFAATAAVPTPPGQSVQVSTSGVAASWSASSTDPWISVDPPAGTGDGNFTVTVTANGLAAGSHSGTVTVSAAGLVGSPRTVVVDLSVAPGPRLLVLPTSAQWTVDQDALLPAAQAFSVSNLGTGSIAWTVGGAPSWLQVMPGSGAAPGGFTAGPLTTSLPVGRYTAILTVTAAGTYDAPQQVAVTYTILGPALAFTPERLVIEVVDGVVVSPAATVQVGGAAPGALPFTVRSTRPWLSPSVASGSTGDAVTVAVTNPLTLPHGVLDGALVFESVTARNSPAPVPVVILVRGSDAPAAHPRALAFDVPLGALAPGAASLALDEAGDAEGAWSLTALPAWLAADIEDGLPGARVTFDVDAAGLPAGPHEGVISVATARGAFEVPARLTVHAGPALVATPGDVSLTARTGAVSAGRAIAVANVGASPGGFTVLSGATWLRAVPSSGVAPTSVTVTADAAALAPGDYAASLAFDSASGADGLVDVTLRVVAPSVPLAAFDVAPGGGCAPLLVTFTDRTVGSVTSRTWDFGDGATSTAVSPTHAFLTAGKQVVTLTTAGVGGSSSASAMVGVRQPPLAHAGPDRRLHFEPDGETRVRLEGARIAAAAPARVFQSLWTTDFGVFADTGTSNSALERPVLVLASSRGGVTANLTLAVTDDTGCSAVDQARFTLPSDLDVDGDLASEILDNCPGRSNFSQADSDLDGRGDGCDICPAVFDPLQLDLDLNGQGDACQASLVWSVSLAGEHARPCDGSGGLVVDVGAPAPLLLRRLRLDLSSGPEVLGGEALGAALGAGGVVAGSRLTADGVAELRAPAGFPAGGATARLDVAVLGSGLVDVPCASARLGLAETMVVASCADGEIIAQPDGDVAPATGPDGRVNVADVVRLLRAATGLDDLTDDELARGDLAPGAEVAGTWQANPNCRIDVADVILALRVAVGLVSLP